MLSIFVHVFHVIRYIDAKIDLPEFISRNPGAASRQFGLSWRIRLKFKSSFPRFESSCVGLISMYAAIQPPVVPAEAPLRRVLGVAPPHPISFCWGQPRQFLYRS